jgi:hypothetical protein
MIITPGISFTRRDDKVNYSCPEKFFPVMGWLASL